MFDRDNSGTVDIHGFGKLFEYINQWLNIFKTYDRNQSGQIDDQELNQGEWRISSLDSFAIGQHENQRVSILPPFLPLL